MTDLQASIGCAQLKKLPGFIEARKCNWKVLREGLSQFADKLILPRATAQSDPSWFGFVISVREDAGFSRHDLVHFLEERKIETRNLFSGNLLRHPAFLDIEHRTTDSLANSDRITNQTFFVGCYPGLQEEHLKYMVDVFAEFFRG